MLWYKAWLETRWRFVIGLAMLMLSACGTVLSYPRVVQVLSNGLKVEMSGEIGRQISEAVTLAHTYRGFVWSQFFHQNMLQTWGVFAVLLGTGGLLAQASGRGALFTLSLPVTRNRLLAIRAGIGLGELLVLAIVPSLLLPLLSPAVGQSYSVADALVHAACLFIAGAVLFSAAFLLSTIFSDVWRPLLVVICAAAVLAFAGIVFPEVSRYGVFRVMSAESYFRGEGVPWLGLLASAALSIAMLYTAARNTARQDF